MSLTGTLHHIALSASDYEASRTFYQFLLADLLGYKKVMEQPYCTMWSHHSGTRVAVSPGDKTAHNKHNPGLHHLAFTAATPELIDEFYNKIVQFQEANKATVAHSTILDKPAAYPQYGEGYYAVFFTDPDNIKLELVYTPPHKY
ncbi:glyoxalase/bleomycin resistance protein/dioxygenase [Dissophora ornata]|nr:glyoxalase/bleomycin resistance protein/dioxygenase [Dissophora ornata]